MNTKALNSLAQLICAAQEQDRTPMGIAFAIDAAGRHMSPETAAELSRLLAKMPELTRRRNEDMALRGELAPMDEPRKVPFALGASLVPAVQWLVTRVSELESERHVTNEALSDAAVALRAGRDRIAELEAERTSPAPVIPRAMGPGEQRLAERAMAELEATHYRRLGLTPPASTREEANDSPLHHTYRFGRDLPEMPRG